MRNLAVILLSLSLALSGCATSATGGRELTASGKILLKESTSIGVRRFFADKPHILARSAKIRAVIVELQGKTSGLVSLTDLKASVIKEIDARVENKLDHDDLVSLANMLHAVMLDYVGSDQLDAGALVKVNEYLEFVLAALPA
jgi:hypothetical protein